MADRPARSKLANPTNEPIEMINDTLANILRTVQTPGDYYTRGSCSMPMPLIEVAGARPLALPLSPAQAAQLVAAAERAP
jgi:hypothetical protein